MTKLLTTDIICTSCGDVLSIFADSVALPFECNECIQKQQTLKSDAQAFQQQQPPQQAPQEAQQEVPQEAPQDAQSVEYAPTYEELQEEVEEANRFEEASYKAINILTKSLDFVAKERDSFRKALGATVAILARYLTEIQKKNTELQSVRAENLTLLRERDALTLSVSSMIDLDNSRLKSARNLRNENENLRREKDTVGAELLASCEYNDFLCKRHFKLSTENSKIKQHWAYRWFIQ